MFKRLLISMIAVSFLLLGCDFRPEHKVIEYQEEVKLSDGSFIWVDIKRHYRLVGEPFQEKNYLINSIEMTWDTGFKNIGKYTIKSDAANSSAIYTLDKHNDMWYVVLSIGRSLDFYSLGNEIRYNTLVYIIDEGGGFIRSQDIPRLYRNIMYYNVDNKKFTSQNPAKFTWQEKIGQFNNDGLAVGNELYPNLVHQK